MSNFRMNVEWRVVRYESTECVFSREEALTFLGIDREEWEDITDDDIVNYFVDVDYMRDEDRQTVYWNMSDYIGQDESIFDGSFKEENEIVYFTLPEVI